MKHLAFIKWIKQNLAIEKLYVIFAAESERNPYWLFSPVPSTYRRTDITGAAYYQYDVAMANFTSISTESIDAALEGGYADNHTTIQALFDTERLIDWVNTQEQSLNYPKFDGCIIEKVEVLTKEATPAAVAQDWAKFLLTVRVSYKKY